MPRCADQSCGRWRPDLTALPSVAGSSVRKMGALQFNGRWYCSRGCVEQAVRAGLSDERTQARSLSLPPLKLGVLLRHAGAVTQPELDAALEAMAGTGLKIGEQLEALGYATAGEVLRALATQAGVKYLMTFDISRVERGPVPLPAATVRALGLVPFEADEVLKKLHVVCAAPVPRAAMRALVRLTGWAPEVYLVTDRVCEAALDAYKPAEESQRSHDALTVTNVTAAAAHVADMVAQARTVTMQHAQCNTYRWVRVHAAQQVSDLLVTSTQEERGCQAELTAH
jgi:Type II secretion system (T2SS), protein E, N-terminal domain